MRQLELKGKAYRVRFLRATRHWIHMGVMGNKAAKRPIF